ncbi:MAG: polyphosphate kinase [Pseudomonadales bacterium]
MTGAHDTVLAEATSGRIISRADFDARVPSLRVAMLNAQFDLRTSAESVIVLVAGDDRLGVVEVVQRMHEWLDARHLDTHIFDEPTPEERERPAQWRYWQALPARGRMAVYVGAWPLDAVGALVSGRVDAVGYEAALVDVLEFERSLASEGVRVIKFWVHTPPAERARRLEQARRDPRYDWRVEPADWDLHEIHARAEPDVERLLVRTSTDWSPWHVLDGRDDRTRDLALAEHLVADLEAQASMPPARPLLALPPGAARLPSIDLTRMLKSNNYDRRLDDLQGQLAELSRRARRLRQSTVLVFEGWDAAGKGGSIRRITQALSVRDYRVVPVSAPDEAERAHPWLWRFWCALPRAGTLLILDRSWYGRVLVERVEGYIDTPVWQRAYGEIRAFESALIERGYVLLKFWLHIDRSEQLARFKARENTPYKKYKIGAEDYRNRARWDDYEVAAEEMFARTSTAAAPWHLVGMNDKRAGRIEILETLCAALSQRLDDVAPSA